MIRGERATRPRTTRKTTAHKSKPYLGQPMACFAITISVQRSLQA
jgi:hypothetical protein